MISIIICSRKNSISYELKENIRKTIGVAYELVIIENSANQFSIFEAYNIGMKRSKGDFCCFMHDDIAFRTNNWGTIITEIFKNDLKIGLIGIAGSKLKTKTPSNWWACPENKKSIFIKQHCKKKPVKMVEQGFDDQIEEVSVIDGVFMVMRKATDFEFNEDLSGFHNYDLNISLETVKNQKKVVTTNKILIEHFSSGSLNKSWCKSTSKFHEIYSQDLPVYIGDPKSLEKFENKNLIYFIKRLLDHNLKSEIKIWWLHFFKLNPYSPYHVLFGVRYFITGLRS